MVCISLNIAVVMIFTFVMLTVTVDILMLYMKRIVRFAVIHHNGTDRYCVSPYTGGEGADGVVAVSWALSVITF
jgi:hypothetical protein